MALTKNGITSNGRTAMVKSGDNYNIDVVKHIALVINDGTIHHKDKELRLKNMIDAVYVDGWNHGYAMVDKEARENQMGLNHIAKGNGTKGVKL